MSFLRRVKALWMAFVDVLGRVQTAILLSIIYHIAIGPLGLLSRLGKWDLLGLRPVDGDSYSVESPPISTTVEQAQRQF